MLVKADPWNEIMQESEEYKDNASEDYPHATSVEHAAEASMWVYILEARRHGRESRCQKRSNLSVFLSYSYLRGHVRASKAAPTIRTVLAALSMFRSSILKQTTQDFPVVSVKIFSLWLMARFAIRTCLDLAITKIHQSIYSPSYSFW